MDILKMKTEDLLALDPKKVDRLLTPEEVVHMARTQGAFWEYDYDAAKAGRVGMHALLKSENHSDGFFVSKILLASENIRLVISAQIVRKMLEEHLPKPDFVVGVPDGATKLGEDIAEMLGVEVAEMKKVDGRITLVTSFDPWKTLLLVEDFCTKGTGFTEAVLRVIEQEPETRIVPFDPVILNRGGLKAISVPGVGDFKILPVVEKRVQDWAPADCPLCQMGSKPIKPKATDENWLAITTSQL